MNARSFALPTVVLLLSASLGAAGDVKPAGPDEIAKGTVAGVDALEDCRRAVQAEVERVARVPPLIAGNVALIRFSSPAQIHPLLVRHIRPPCTLRMRAKITPFCPEGPRYCGVPVWKLEPSQYERLI